MNQAVRGHVWSVRVGCECETANAGIPGKFCIALNQVPSRTARLFCNTVSFSVP